MPKICGVSIASSTATFVIIEGNKSEYELVQSDIKRITIEDDRNHEQVKLLLSDTENFFKENEIEKVIIKKPLDKGKFRSSSQSFKIEAIIQLASENVDLVSAIVLKAFTKNNPVSEDLLGKINKYQHDAYFAAHYGMLNDDCDEIRLF